LELPLTDHIHRFIALKRIVRRVKGSEAEPWPHQSFDETMILLDLIELILGFRSFGLCQAESS
jgi:hypothetical protein